MPISLRDPKIASRARHAAADSVCDPFGHHQQREAPVETEAVAAEVPPAVLGEIEGVEGAAEAGLEVSQQCVDPAECGRSLGCLPPV